MRITLYIHKLCLTHSIYPYNCNQHNEDGSLTEHNQQLQLQAGLVLKYVSAEMNLQKELK